MNGYTYGSLYNWYWDTYYDVSPRTQFGRCIAGRWLDEYYK